MMKGRKKVRWTKLSEKDKYILMYRGRERESERERERGEKERVKGQ
jgi:hypothetical protein